MLCFNDVSYSYPNGAKVLNHVSFTIRKGEQVGLIGCNGAGKSTLMKLSLGLLHGDGSILVDSTPITVQNLPEIRKKIGFVLQDSNNQMFMPRVLDDMMFGPLNYGTPPQEARTNAEKVLEQLNISYLRDRHNHRISGGEKRMAAIATILAMKPSIILMDEPSAALDPKNRRQVIKALNNLPTTKVIASHDLDMILETCNRVLLLSGGEIIADGPTEYILTNRELLEANGLELPFCLAELPEKYRIK